MLDSTPLSRIDLAGSVDQVSGMMSRSIGYQQQAEMRDAYGFQIDRNVQIRVAVDAFSKDWEVKLRQSIGIAAGIVGSAECASDGCVGKLGGLSAEMVKASPLNVRVQPVIKANPYDATKFKDFMVDFSSKFGRGFFDVVVFENEMNSAEFWAYDPWQYLQLVRIAKDVKASTNADFLISDGGIQGGVLNYIVAEWLAETKLQPGRAITFLNRAGKSDIQNIGQLHERLVSLEQNCLLSGEDRFCKHRNARQLIKQGLWQDVDIVNFHYYDSANALPEVMEYIRASTRDASGHSKPIHSNEVGTINGYLPANDERRASLRVGSDEMVRKLTVLRALGVGPVIWFNRRPSKLDCETSVDQTTEQSNSCRHVGYFAEYPTTGETMGKLTINAEVFRALSASGIGTDYQSGDFEMTHSGELVRARLLGNGKRIVLHWTMSSSFNAELNVTDDCQIASIPSLIKSRVAKIAIGFRPVMQVCGQAQ
jgi:hypothetical protein